MKIKTDVLNILESNRAWYSQRQPLCAEHGELSDVEREVLSPQGPDDAPQLHDRPQRDGQSEEAIQ